MGKKPISMMSLFRESNRNCKNVSTSYIPTTETLKSFYKFTKTYNELDNIITKKSILS